ncbi:hypothetical protein C5E07_12320 [Pseudoclavibacter sp. RFBJ3]|uniref:hypothetical protein n=1 Tax=unclassified Pseudoclavibacter TaxID=2615177 RepID=UPI000CE928E8|nr:MULTISPECIES: hypothetical protein [unclassified Pseudoclavibacter]MBF4552344.1 hypothetical protein [Pseudoclavibacter sp. VKM Ac-2888]PPF36496.1 hypothetical protein C5E05_09610 [Pseudoclavibacter sp. AY1H1]PPF74460.1 hypothetical protein C5B99_13610 [Pseudoclavibacter sp. Z016]PPF82491.1 hypothetical protein C5C12_11395 [Pseudoclavibacter sp. RFBJ5]PPF91384.1 hypothetical protein C5E07_12320 [Pseudoclavibacter sp. RFBJ3]
MSNGETPLGGQYDPDELEELESQAERRGTGRGLIIGLLIAAAVAIAAIVFVLMNPLGQQAPPDNTAPVTTLPQATEVAVPETLIVTATPGPTVTVTETAAPDPDAEASAVQVSLSRAYWVPDQRVISAAALVSATEPGGTCTLVLKNGPVTFVATASAAAPTSAGTDASSCIVNLRDESITPGDWEAVMQYEGPAGSGVSAPMTVTVT